MPRRARCSWTRRGWSALLDHQNSPRCRGRRRRGQALPRDGVRPRRRPPRAARARRSARRPCRTRSQRDRVAAATGLDHAHRRCGPDGRPLQLVHRDVSLSNIMVGHDGAVKVVDFGIAPRSISSVHTAPGRRPRQGELHVARAVPRRRGRPSHRRVRARRRALRADTGARCFQGERLERMLAVVRGEYSRRASCRELPATLEAVIDSALAATPASATRRRGADREALEQGALSPAGATHRRERARCASCSLEPGSSAARLSRGALVSDADTAARRLFVADRRRGSSTSCTRGGVSRHAAAAAARVVAQRDRVDTHCGAGQLAVTSMIKHGPRQGTHSPTIRCAGGPPPTRTTPTTFRAGAAVTSASTTRAT